MRRMLTIAVLAMAWNFFVSTDSASAQTSNFSNGSYVPSTNTRNVVGPSRAGGTQLRTPNAGIARNVNGTVNSASSNRFSFFDLLPRWSGTAVTRGPLRANNTASSVPKGYANGYNPVMPINSSASDPLSAIKKTGLLFPSGPGGFVMPTVR